MKVKKCSVEECVSTKRTPNIIFFFSPPKALYSQWKEAISNANCNETLVKFICADHFLPEDIIFNYSGPQDIAAVCI